MILSRKIIQIACGISDASNNAGRERLYALAEDGTLWLKTAVITGKKDFPPWVQIPGPPEPPTPSGNDSFSPKEFRP